MPLTKKDTDALLGRLDERSDEQLRRTAAIEIHLERLNGSVGLHSVDIQALTTTIFGQGADKGMAGGVIRNATRSLQLLSPPPRISFVNLGVTIATFIIISP